MKKYIKPAIKIKYIEVNLMQSSNQQSVTEGTDGDEAGAKPMFTKPFQDFVNLIEMRGED